jgi:hypothetical protein
MLTALWWIGDALLLFAVAPIALYLSVRLILGLVRANRVLNQIAATAQSLAQGLPPALGEVVSAVQAVEGLVPAKTTASTR